MTWKGKIGEQGVPHLEKRMLGWTAVAGNATYPAGWGFEQPGLVEGSLPLAGGLEPDDLSGPFQTILIV